MVRLCCCALALALVRLLMPFPALGQELSGCPTAGPPVAPFDLAFAPDGTLFLTDPEAGRVYRLDAEGCRTIGTDLPGVSGIAVTTDGRVCAAHYTSADPLRRLSALSCWQEETWNLEASALGNGISGLAPTRDGIWLAVWEDTPVESRNGLLLLVAGGGVTREVRLEDGIPQFLAPLHDGGLLITVVFEDASGTTAGEILERSADGHLVRLDHAFRQPAGIASNDRGIWVADAASGELILLTPEGRRLIQRRDLLVPSGLALSPDGDLCVAEHGSNRITCLSTGTHSESEVRHEDDP